MLPVRGKTWQHCCAPHGRKKCFWRFSETFFVCRTQNLWLMITSAMLPPQCVLILQAPWSSTSLKSPMMEERFDKKNSKCRISGDCLDCSLSKLSRLTCFRCLTIQSLITNNSDKITNILREKGIQDALSGEERVVSCQLLRYRSHLTNRPHLKQGGRFIRVSNCRKGGGGREGKGRGREGKGREGKGREGKGREGKGREGKGREGKGREGKGREGKGREGKGRGGG